MLCLKCWFCLVIIALQRWKKWEEGWEVGEERRGEQGKGENRKGPGLSKNSVSLFLQHQVQCEILFFKFNGLNYFPLSSSTSSLSHFLKEMNTIVLDMILNTIDCILDFLNFHIKGKSLCQLQTIISFFISQWKSNVIWKSLYNSFFVCINLKCGKILSSNKLLVLTHSHPQHLNDFHFHYKVRVLHKLLLCGPGT